MFLLKALIVFYHYYPRSFLADSIIIPNLQDQKFAKPTSCNVENQKENIKQEKSLYANDFNPTKEDYDDFFHLRDEPIRHISINFF